MKQTIFLIRHSMTGVDIENYIDYKNVNWEEYNTNMVLNIEGEEKAKNLCSVKELQNIEELYASSSPRAIATAKYLSEYKKLPIKLDDRINERKFGVNYINELPQDFTYQMFNDKDKRFGAGETLNELDKRMTSFIEEKLNSNKNNIALVIHGIIMLSYLGTIATETFDGKSFNIKFNNKEILNGNPSSPDIYKITFEEKKVVDIDRIIL